MVNTSGFGFKLVSLEIEGFRNFQNKFVLDLRSPSGDPINYFVLSGPNGSGKTTVLEAISLVFGGGGSSDLNSNSRLSAEVESISSKSIFRFDRKIETYDRINFSVEYLSEQSANLYKKIRKLDPLFGHEWLGRLNTYWRDFRDDGTHFVIDHCDEREWDLFINKGDKRLYSVASMSSGEQAVIGLAIPLLQTKFEGLLLIDYPEQYLHPRWVGRIVRALRNLAPNAQIIVATNSDDAWEDAKSWERILLNN